MPRRKATEGATDAEGLKSAQAENPQSVATTQSSGAESGNLSLPQGGSHNPASSPGPSASQECAPSPGSPSSLIVGGFSGKPNHQNPGAAPLEDGRQKIEDRSPKSAPISHLPPPISRGYRPRSGQVEFERGVELHRISAFLTRRQYGKTTTVARIALKKMMRTPGHDVVFGSVKLDLGREIVRKESAAMRQAIAGLTATAAGAQNLFQLTDAKTGKALSLNSQPSTLNQITADDFDELYEAQRLEFRLYHSNTIYSRTKVVALTPDAVGETGDLLLDEIGRVKNFQAVWEAVKPIIASNPRFRCTLTTTPPPDDSHYSFEMLMPPIGETFPVNPRGNWYRSEMGYHVLRVDAWDAAADGVTLYDDDTGAPISPADSRAAESDKDAWDRNYGVRFVFGGAAACGLLELDTAQRRGIGKCACFQIETDADLDHALKFLVEHLGDGKVGLGWDLATTEKESSNPSAVTVMEQRGVELLEVGVFVWKTKDPKLATERMHRIAHAVALRKSGGPPRRLCIDATNERYFAMQMRDHFGGFVPVELVIGSETIELPGREESITMKQYLGDQYVAELNDNHLTLPPERYLKEDHRLPRKEKGQFVCIPDPQGRHGDTFDSGKLALRALRSTQGAITSTLGMTVGRPHVATFRPPRLTFA